MTSASLAEWSNLAVYSSMLVLIAALIAFAVSFAARGQRVMSPELVSVGAGAPTSADSPHAPAEALAPGRRAGNIAMALTWLATGLLLVGLVLRGVWAGRVPWGNMYEFSLAWTLGILAVFLVVSTRRDIRWLGLPVVFLALLSLGSNVDPETHLRMAIAALRARFDEESNLALASRLQAAGAVVIYGVVGFKTHAKMMLILRRENGEIVRYAHLGTGNYHAGNAKLYTDYSLLTADVALGEDVSKLFSQLIGMGKTLRMKKLLHAPFTLKKTLLDLIAKETAAAAEGKPAHIIAKFNSLTDPKVIRALYKASQTGVKIDLVVRGMCCLRPGIAGVSHNIHVRSIIGRFLEHTRVFYFLNGGDEQIYLSSADWMERNLDKRVETCFPVEGKKLITRVKKELESYLTDNTQAWVLQSDGRYLRQQPTGNQNPRSAQSGLLEKLTAPVIIAR